MSLQDRMIRDLKTILNPNKFAINVDIDGGDRIQGIFDSDYLGEDILGQTVSTEDPKLLIRTSDIESQGLTKRSKLRLNGETYYIKNIQKGSDGLTNLTLSKDA
jgi:hypothetical protein